MKTYIELKKNLIQDFESLKKIKVAVLGDTSTQFLEEALRGLGYDYRLNIEIFAIRNFQIEQEIVNLDSDLYGFKPEIVIIFQSAHKLLDEYNKSTQKELNNLASDRLILISKLHRLININLGAKILYYNYTEIDDSVFGNFAQKITSSFIFQLRKLNYELMVFASENSNFYICDIASIQNYLGKSTFFKSYIYINTDMVLSMDVLPNIVAKTLDIILVLEGREKKCLILDLDNVMWGGVIGEDGIENIEIGNLGIGKAFTEFQYWLKKLKQRGIILCVCSKNFEAIAKEPFERHPDMILRIDDIAVFLANWENKATNIRHIQQILNIGFDAMVFLDDNPFERNIVRENIPDIIVPELPVDPADYLEFLYKLNLFEASSYSSEDSSRNKLYQIESQRSSLMQNYTNESDFLQSLKMLSEVESFTKFSIPRISQLTLRSNQFNLRTIRYTASELEVIAASRDFYTLSFSLEDKLGNYGIICAVILKIENEHTQ